MAEAARRILKNTGFLYAKMGITMFISLYTTRLILNSLGASDFGVFNIVGGAIAMLGFLNSTMAGATQRFISVAEGEGDKEKQKRIFNISVVLHTAIAIIVGIALVVAGYFFFNGILNIPEGRMLAAKVVYGSLIISTVFTVMTVPYDAVMNAHENMKYYAVVGVGESLLKLAVAVLVFYTAADKLIVYGAAMACIPLVTLSVMRIYCHRHYEECVVAPRRYRDKRLLGEMAAFAGWNFGSSASSIVGNYGLGVVLNIFFGTVLNAAQGIAAQLVGQLATFARTMLKALNPVIAKSEGAANRHLMQAVTLAGSKFSFLITAAFAIPAIVEMPFILQIWLREVPEYAVVFTRLQTVRILIEQMAITLGTAIMARGDIRHYNGWYTLLNLLPLPLTYLAFRAGAAPTALYIVSIAIWCVGGNILSVIYARKKCDIAPADYRREVLAPCLWVAGPTFAVGYAVMLLFPQGWERLFVTGSLCGLTFAVLLWAKGLNATERTKTKEILRQIRQKIGWKACNEER